MRRAVRAREERRVPAQARRASSNFDATCGRANGSGRESVQGRASPLPGGVGRGHVEPVGRRFSRGSSPTSTFGVESLIAVSGCLQRAATPGRSTGRRTASDERANIVARATFLVGRSPRIGRPCAGPRGGAAGPNVDPLESVVLRNVSDSADSSVLPAAAFGKNPGQSPAAE